MKDPVRWLSEVHYFTSTLLSLPASLATLFKEGNELGLIDFLGSERSLARRDHHHKPVLPSDQLSQQPSQSGALRENSILLNRTCCWREVLKSWCIIMSANTVLKSPSSRSWLPLSAVSYRQHWLYWTGPETQKDKNGWTQRPPERSFDASFQFLLTCV